MQHFNRGGRGQGDWKPTFKATCADCGNTCEVPFKPNGMKPVYCRDCFPKHGGGERKEFGGDRGGFGGPRKFDRGGRDDRFSRDDRGGRGRDDFRSERREFAPEIRVSQPAPRPAPDYGVQFRDLGAKLDRVIELLEASASGRRSGTKSEEAMVASDIMTVDTKNAPAKKKAAAKKKK